MQVTRLHAALRGCDCEELHDYLSKEYKYGTIENDIKTYVKLLTIKKNMLFFFPYRFSLKKQYSFKCAVESITSALEQDFKESNLFRGKYCMGYDTYLSYVYDDNLIVNKFEKGGKLQMVDTIYLFKSKTYCKLYEYVSY